MNVSLRTVRSWWAAILLGVSPGAGWAIAPVSVRLVTLQETRTRNFTQDEMETPLGTWSGDSQPVLSMRLQIQGEGLLSTTAYGGVRIESIEADRGHPITYHNGGETPDSSALPELLGPRALRLSSEMREKGFGLTLDFDAPARQASRIVTLRGSLLMRTGGREKLLTFKLDPQRHEQAMEHATLTAANLQVRLLDPRDASTLLHGEGESALLMEVKGDLPAIKSLRVRSADGRNILRSSWSPSGEDRYIFWLTETVLATTQLELTVMLEQETVRIPFEFQDLALP